ncbi:MULTISPECIES: hypothetical protein [unclassified Streptomyces]|nr:hypothetical protein [Streptomyces sp. CB02058]
MLARPGPVLLESLREHGPMRIGPNRMTVISTAVRAVGRER